MSNLPKENVSMDDDLAQLLDSLKYRPVATTAAQMRLAAATIEAQMDTIENLRKSFSEHCQDCCCARSWKALGITDYTGLSIPEHIERLRNALLKAVEAVQVWHNMGVPAKDRSNLWDLYWRNAPEMKPIREALTTEAKS